MKGGYVHNSSTLTIHSYPITSPTNPGNRRMLFGCANTSGLLAMRLCCVCFHRGASLHGVKGLNTHTHTITHHHSPLHPFSYPFQPDPLLSKIVRPHQVQHVVRCQGGAGCRCCCCSCCCCCCYRRRRMQDSCIATVAAWCTCSNLLFIASE